MVDPHNKSHLVSQLNTCQTIGQILSPILTQTPSTLEYLLCYSQVLTLIIEDSSFVIRGMGSWSNLNDSSLWILLVPD